MRTGRLNGASVAFFEGRSSGELARLILRCGGRPLAVAAVREADLPAESITRFLDRLCGNQFALVIFSSGVGVSAIVREAERFDRLDAVLAALRHTRIACRDPKPIAALRRHFVPVHFRAAIPYTTTDLLRALDGFDLSAAPVAVVQHGERDRLLTAALASRGARIEEICLHEWLLPDDLGPLRALVQDIIAGQIDALAFTSQVECRHLFRVAADIGLASELTRALNTRTTPVVIGPVCRSALKEHGVIPRVMPAAPKMGALVAALAEYFELTPFSRAAPER